MEPPPDRAPPGAPERDAALRRRLDEALAALGPSYRPRTRRLREDGSPRLLNRLVFEKSPYLLQHAHNPVDWWAWGEEARAEARRRDLPVFLSVGYAACHWCHVMEHESFEDEEIGRFLNERFVAVKVDREERPDVDAVYMAAVQAFSGGGGWPMTVLLDLDGRPFFGGTYLPPRDGGRGGRMGLLTLLRRASEAWARERAALLRQGAELTRAVEESAQLEAAASLPTAEPLHEAARLFAASFDAAWGGFGPAPKFPRADVCGLLLRYARRTGRAEFAEMTAATLEGMRRGGLYDHVGGGFHRYATDERWFCPHFEKMLYDNALLAAAYLEGWQATARPAFRETAAETLEYLLREMRHPEGAFYSATDADSEGVEGKFFCWSRREMDEVLGPDDARIAAAYFGAGEPANWEPGMNILHAPRSFEEVGRETGLPAERVAEAVGRSRRALYDARRRRVPPLLDDKVLTAWNGLAISALARCGAAWGEVRFVEAARAAARFVLDRMRVSDGRLLARWRDGEARFPAYLDDYAFLARGLLDLFEADFDVAWLRRAKELVRLAEDGFADPAGGYFFTASDHERLLVREKPSHDGAMPAGNSVMALVLLRLAAMTGEASYRERGEAAIRAFGEVLDRSPAALPVMLQALDFALDRPKEILIARGAAADAAAADPFLPVLGRTFVPNRTVVAAAKGDDVAADLPSAVGKVAEGGRPTAYVCEEGVCRRPTADPGAFGTEIRRVEPYPPRRSG